MNKETLKLERRVMDSFIESNKKYIAHLLDKLYARS